MLQCGETEYHPNLTINAATVTLQCCNVAKFEYHLNLNKNCGYRDAAMLQRGENWVPPKPNKQTLQLL